jgi:hypothetical protein
MELVDIQTLTGSKYDVDFDLICGVLTPLSARYQLYHGDHF